MTSIPKRLRKEPLIEAIWQIQFEPASNQSVGDILPGALYSALQATYPKLQLQRLPTADIPAPFAQIDPNLRFAAKYRMEPGNGPFLFQTGERIVTANCRRPYAGWEVFKSEILSLIDLVEKSGLIRQPLRHSLRYLDLLTLDTPNDLSALQFALTVGGQNVQRLPFQMRMEFPDNEFTYVIQIATPTNVGFPDGSQQTGTIVDIETFITTPSEDWGVLKKQVDSLHDRSKDMFFQRLLTPEAIVRMEPEY